MLINRNVCITLFFGLWACAAQATTPYDLFITEIDKLETIVAKAQENGQDGRQAERYGCIRQDIATIKAGVQAFAAPPKKPAAPIKRLCGNYRGLKSSSVVVSTPEERKILTILSQEIIALIKFIPELEAHTPSDRLRFGDEVLRGDLWVMKHAITEVIEAPRVAPRGVEALIGGR